MSDTNPFIEHPAKFVDRSEIFPEGGIQYTFKFANGYGASVIKSRWTYGGDAGLWEIAVLGQNDEIAYDTPITDDVIGYLTDDDVRETLRKIAELP